jgi:DNA (cytosine-5)-methyltransferase 1
MKALDLFCCAGGASMGLHQAGFEVTGVDIVHHKNYPFQFVQADATKLDIEFLRQFDLIWASPPCQTYTLAGQQWRKNGKKYPDLVEKTRKILQMSRIPYVIENVPQAPLLKPIMLCGAMFGLKTYRHRCFESNFVICEPEHPKHIHPNAKMGRPTKEGEFLQIVGHFSGVKQAQEMFGTPWMTQGELAEAIPPAYSKHIAEQFLTSLAPEAPALVAGR